MTFDQNIEGQPSGIPIKFGFAGTGPKELLVLLPLLGSLLALTFDVGYFWGTDINFFSVFSISEHITFAVQVLPAAIIFAAIGLWMAALASYGLQLWNDYPDLRKKWRRSSRRLALASVFVVIPSFFLGWPASTIIYIGIWGAVAVSLALGLRRTPTILLPFALIVMLLVAFGFGLDTAAQYRSWKSFNHVVSTSNGALEAKIIRSGERGVLFYSAPNNELRLLPWNEIKGLARKQ
jgi:hypothetical protein